MIIKVGPSILINLACHANRGDLRIDHHSEYLMKKTTIHLVIALLILSWAAACQPLAAPAQTPADGSPGPTLTPGPMDSTAIPTPTSEQPGAIPTITPGQQGQAFIFPGGLSLDVPAGWVLENSTGPGSIESAWLRPPDPADPAIGIEVADRPLSDRAVTDPFTWMPNEGGYEVHWSQLTTINGLEGLLFVWGVQQAGAWESPPWLMAIFYDEHRELDIRLTTEFTAQQLEFTNTAGLAEAVNNGFIDFKQVLQSLKFVETVTFSGVIRLGADLGGKKDHCAEGLYLVAEEGVLAGQLSSLLLRVPGPGGQSALLTDPQWNGKAVTVTGQYPAQEAFCEALMCECEEYILVARVDTP